MTPQCDSRFAPRSTPRAEHETIEHSAERTGEKPGEAAGGLRQCQLRDLGPTVGPSRYMAPAHVIRHAWASRALA